MDRKYLAPECDAHLAGPQRSAWMKSRDPCVLCLPLLNFTLQDFPSTQGSQNFSFSTLSPPSRFCFPNSTRPLSLTWPNLMCQISGFDNSFVDATFVEPLTTSASRVLYPKICPHFLVTKVF